jgi:iron complex transport system permease protein
MTGLAATLASRSPRRRSGYRIAALAALLLLAVLASLAIGPVMIAPGRVIGILNDAIAGVLPGDTQAVREAIVVLDLRLPRTILGLLVGAALAVSGAILQGIFRNPLADPIFVGISPGAAFAAVSWIVLGYSVAALLPVWAGRFGLTLAAFAGAFVITLILQRFSSRAGRTSVATLLFTGIALGALAQAGTGFLLFLASDQQLREFTFWTLGSLGGATWNKVAMAAPLILVSFALAAPLARGLDALSLGEAEAFHVGTDVERLKRRAILAVAAAVGAAVAVAGVIGFLGLVVPHLLRLMIGPSHRMLLIGSALLGGALLVGADVIARTVAAPAELPLGVVTAALGAPYFLWLLNRYRAALGG